MKNLSLNAKFIFILGIFILTAMGVSLLGIQKLNELNESLNTIVATNVPIVVAAEKLNSITREIKNQEKVFIIDESPEAMAKTGDVLNKLEGHARQTMEGIRSLSTHQETRASLANIDELLKKWQAISNKIREFSLAGKNAEAMALARGESREAMEKIEKLLDGIVAFNEKILADESKRTDALYADSRNIIIVSSVLAIGLGLLLAFFILRAVNASIDRVINNLNDSSGQVTSAAQQIAASSQELSQGATEQASSLEETSSAVEEMNSMVQKNAESAQQSLRTSQTSGDSANRGRKVVEEMKRAMTEIDAANVNIMNQTTESNVKISEIVKVIAEIGNKTKVINDIVFQTKLLSFNASVEAARAGEHGKGFAVVAEEVGNLAQMSGNAAKEISSMLDSSIEKVEGIVRDTKTSVERLVAESKAKVELGTRVAADCGEVLDDIVNKVTVVSQMSHSISSASDEQARGISEITKAVSQLDQMTQQNAAISEEAASAAEELSSQAESMQSIVQALISAIKGGNVTVSGSVPRQALSRRSSGPSGNAKPKSNVVHFGKKPEKPLMEHVKMVSGSDVVPAEDDPRFKDI